MKPKIYYAPESFDLDNSEDDYNAVRNINELHDNDNPYNNSNEGRFFWKSSSYDCACGQSQSYNIYPCIDDYEDDKRAAIIVCCDACFRNCDSIERVY